MGNYLVHHGIQGQKWGKRNGPPYPLSAGAHSSSEKKAGWRQSLSDHVSRKKKEKAKRAAVEKRKKTLAENQAKKELEENKEMIKAKVIMSGDAKTIYANRNMLTNAELKAALDRVDMDVKMRNLMGKQNKSAGDKADSAIKWVERGAKIYATVANIYDAKSKIDKAKEPKEKEDPELKELKAKAEKADAYSKIYKAATAKAKYKKDYGGMS